MKNYILCLALACSSVISNHCYGASPSPSSDLEEGKKPHQPILVAQKIPSPTEVVEELGKRGAELNRLIEPLQKDSQEKRTRLESTDKEENEKMQALLGKRGLLDIAKEERERGLKTVAEEMGSLERTREDLAKQNEENRMLLEQAEAAITRAKVAFEREEASQRKQQALWERVQTQAGASGGNSLISSLRDELDKKRQKLTEEKEKFETANKRRAELEEAIRENEENRRKKQEELGRIREELEKIIKEQIDFGALQSDIQRQMEEAQNHLRAVEEAQSNLTSFFASVAEQVAKIEALQTEFQTLMQNSSKKPEEQTSSFSRFYSVVSSAVYNVVPASWSSYWASYWSTHEAELKEFWAKNGDSINDIRRRFDEMDETLRKMSSGDLLTHP